MTESVVTAEPGASVRAIAEVMRERNVGSVVLVEDERPVAFVTDRDLALSVIADGRDFGDRAADHASAPVVTAAPDMDVQEAAELMVRHGIRRLVVVADGRLTGIVTLDDLVARTGDSALAAQLSTRVTRAVMPDFFFRARGERCPAQRLPPRAAKADPAGRSVTRTSTRRLGPLATRRPRRDSVGMDLTVVSPLPAPP